MASLPSAEALFPSHTGQARRPKAGLDVLLTKAAIDFQNLSNEHADALLLMLSGKNFQYSHSIFLS